MSGTLMLALLLVGSGCAANAPMAAQHNAPVASSAGPANAPVFSTEPANAPVTSPGPTARPDATPWWCMSFGDGAVGSCHVMQAQCAAAHRYLESTRTSPGEQISDCAPQYEVACFDAQNGRNGRNETICHPTFAICRSHIDDWKSKPSAARRVVSDCRTVSSRPGTESAAAPPGEEADHWWCMSFDGDRLGSCDRSRQLCEDSRSFVLRKAPPGAAVSDCKPQPTAVCIDLVNANGRRLSVCQPNEAICRSAAEVYKQSPSPNNRVISDCHTMN